MNELDSVVGDSHLVLCKSKCNNSLCQHDLKCQNCDIKIAYRGSGQSSLVVTVFRHGKRHVWRLRKQKNRGIVGTQDAEQALQFLVQHVQPILLERYVPTPLLINVCPSLSSQLSSVIRISATIDVQNFTVLQFSDRCFLPYRMFSRSNPIVTVEIKPKCGYISQSDVQKAKASGFRYCSNCISQIYKSRTNKIVKPYDYCPLMLFSGKRKLMRHALVALFRHPQRSLRIFVNGVCIFGSAGVDRESSSDSPICSSLAQVVKTIFPKINSVTSICFVDLICDLLLKPLRGVVEDSSLLNGVKNGYHDSNQNFVDSVFSSPSPEVTVQLSKFSVLGRIYAIQSSVKISVPTAYNIYSKLEQSSCPMDAYSIWNDNDVCSLVDSNADRSFSTAQVRALRQFLLGCTVNDCSLMLTFQLTGEDDKSNDVGELASHQCVLNGSSLSKLVYDVGIIDLDAKCPSKVPSHYHRYTEVLQYLSTLDNPESERAYCF